MTTEALPHKLTKTETLDGLLRHAVNILEDARRIMNEGRPKIGLREPLTEEDRKAIAAIEAQTGMFSVPQLAQAHGLSERTVRRWLDLLRHHYQTTDHVGKAGESKWQCFGKSGLLDQEAA